MTRFILCLALVGWAGTAAAQRVSTVNGAKLLAFCTSKAPTGCDAYISGVADAIAAQGSARAACIPPAVTGVQLRGIMVKWLTNHPESRDRKAGELTVKVLTQVFPCKP